MRGSRSFSYSASLAWTWTSAPTRSSSAHGPIGQPGAVPHAGVEVLGRDAGLVEDADAVVQQRDQHPVDDEAGRVVAADRRLAERRAELERASRRSSSDVRSARTISTSGISGAGLKKCMPTARSGRSSTEAISVTLSAEVFVARIASGRTDLLQLAEELVLHLRGPRTPLRSRRRTRRGRRGRSSC